MKIRGNNSKKFKVAIYCRLSRDDGNLEDSSSIQNQREFLSSYVNDLGWNIVDTYIDDGYSGTNFDRPEFKRMILDAEEGRINCIITKDLSRLGRNYIKAGYFLEEFFPKNDIRYIAVNDNYDTYIDTLNDFVPFKNIVNEWYARDISNKVRFTVNAKAKRGDPIKVSTPLYGYDIDDVGNRIVSPETGPIVKLIFMKYIELKSCSKVAKLLIDMKVFSSRYLQFLKYGNEVNKYGDCEDKKKYAWSSARIRRIITNVEYLGHFVTKKTERVSFKIKVMRKNRNPYFFPNRYPAIIDQETFDNAQRILMTYKDSLAPKNEDAFQKIIYCKCCGKRVTFGVRNSLDNEDTKYRYYCRNRSCSKKAYILKHTLEEVVASEIRELIGIILSNKKNFLEFAVSYTSNKANAGIQMRNEFKNSLLKRKTELEKYIEGAFRAKLEEDITNDIYEKITASYKEELKSIESSLRNTIDEKESIPDYEEESNRFLSALHELSNFESLSLDIVSTFLDKIYLERYRSSKNNREIRVELYYGELQELVKDFIYEAKK